MSKQFSLSLVVLAAACGSSSKKPATTPEPDPAPAEAAAPASDLPAPPPSGGGTSAGPNATPLSPASAQEMAPILTALAQSEVPGGQATGPAVGATFTEGQVFEVPLSILPGKCYSVLFVGNGITELDVQLIMQPSPSMAPLVLAQDQSTGPNAILGGRASGCWKNPTPMGGAGKVVVRATQGGGTAAGQIFVR